MKHSTNSIEIIQDSRLAPAYFSPEYKYHFSFKIFCLTLPKNFVGDPFVFQKISGIEKFHAQEGGGLSWFCRKFFVSQDRKISLGVPSVFQKISVSKKFMHRREGKGHHGIVEKTFDSQDRNEKPGTGTLLFSIKFLVSKQFYG